MGKTSLSSRTMKKRVHIISAVNAKNVSKEGGAYTIRDVCGAVDEIVMNGMLYPADQLARGAKSLEGKPAPAGHPRNAKGAYISAVDGEALFTAYAGAYCANARHEAGRTLVDVRVNAAQAMAHPDGQKLIERLDSAISGTNVDPISVSTGLMAVPVYANGESMGKKYSRVATDIEYDHLALLFNEQPAGSPDQGVGMFLNADGQTEEVETVIVNTEPADSRSDGLLKWIKRLVGNDDVSFDAISEGLHKLLPDGAWLREVFDRYCIWTDANGSLWRQDYSVSSEGSLSFSGTAIQVTRKVEYEEANNAKGDQVKETILAALNSAGVAVAGLDDAKLLEAYNALQAKPHTDKLATANSKLAELELAANAAADAELSQLATELSVNTSLTAADFKAMGIGRLRELKTSAKAAPVITGNGAKPADEFAGYSINQLLEAK